MPLNSHTHPCNQYQDLGIKAFHTKVIRTLEAIMSKFRKRCHQRIVNQLESFFDV